MKQIMLGIGIAAIIVIGALLFTRTSSVKENSSVPADNAVMVDGKQIIQIYAKGGYQPRKSIAKAGIPTILRFNTTGTFDCSASVRIPSMNITKVLPNTGVTDIDIGNQAAGILQGTCGMGMYPFEIDFQI